MFQKIETTWKVKSIGKKYTSKGKKVETIGLHV
jgi:hypothetical protein